VVVGVGVGEQVDVRVDDAPPPLKGQSQTFLRDSVMLISSEYAAHHREKTGLLIQLCNIGSSDRSTDREPQRVSPCGAPTEGCVAKGRARDVWQYDVSGEIGCEVSMVEV
jgi:hypothetical protein